MGVPRYKIIGSIFDGVAAIVSLLDLSTDIWIMITWYKQERMTFFWISFVILLLAQLGHISVFYINHGIWPNNSKQLCHSLLSILFTIPFAPFLSFIFYLVAEQDAWLRTFIDKLPMYNFQWHKAYIDTNATELKQYLEMKLYKHVGFLTEAFIEAFPQSILQLAAIVYFNEPNIISVISILMSMCSLCGKLFVLVMEVKNKAAFWLTFVMDFFGVFFIVSYAFFSPSDPDLAVYFLNIRTICFYEFFVCIVPLAALISIGLHFYWTIRAFREENICTALCYMFGITILWALGLIFSLIMMQIFCSFWILFLAVCLGSDNRLPSFIDDKMPRKFYKEHKEWIVQTKDHDERIMKICTFNTVMIEQLDENKVHQYNKNTFISYLDQHKKTGYKNVNLREMRQKARIPAFKYKIGDPHQWRIPYPLAAIFYELLLDLPGEYQRKWKLHSEGEDFIAMISGFISVCGCLPLYALSRLFHMLLPLFIVIYLYIHGGIILFVHIPIFQVIMWFIYSFLIIAWMILFIKASRNEYYYWHILPNIRRWKAFGKDDEQKHNEISCIIKDRYFQIATLPVVKNLLMDGFGQFDITNMVLNYLNCFDTSIISVEQLLLDKFNHDHIAFIIIDYCFEFDDCDDEMSINF